MHFHSWQNLGEKSDPVQYRICKKCGKMEVGSWVDAGEPLGGLSWDGYHWFEEKSFDKFMQQWKEYEALIRKKESDATTEKKKALDFLVNRCGSASLSIYVITCT